ncbi:MAG TPA: glycine zipper domain-containing protein [Bacteroidota bacterium]|nr:glycine zipper domain-containing protein [Bacteroidota bacterium]
MESEILIGAAAAIVAAAALAYAGARWLRIRTLSAHVYYLPRQEPVSLSSLVAEVYPGARLPGGELDRLRRFGIDGGGPPWTEWIHRQNLGRLAVLSTSGEAGWSGALLLHRIHETDDHFAEALAHLARKRLEAFGDLRRPPHWRTTTEHTKMTSVAYDRQYAERILTDSLKARAHGAVFAGDPSRGTSRCVVDGRSYDLGPGLHFDLQDHLAEYPGTSVLTPDDFFRTDEGLFTIDHAPGTYRLSILGGAGFDAAFGTDKAHAAGAAIAASHAEAALAIPHAPVLAAAGDVDFQNPFLTLGLSTLREIRLLKKKHTNILTSVRNIGLDAAGTGIGSYAGAKAGATIGTAVAPGMGSVVGAIIGGISGAFAGRTISNKIKFAQAETARAHYEEKILAFQQRVQEVTQEAMAVLEEAISREQSVLEASALTRVRELEAATGKFDAKRTGAAILPAGTLREFFAFTEKGIRAEIKEIDTALRAIPFGKRSFWPGEDAVRLMVHRGAVLKRLGELITARTALLDPACPLRERERTEIALELFAAYGGHEKEIREHLAKYRAASAEGFASLAAWPDGALREMARTRAGALRRISSRAETLRTKTAGQLTKDVARAKRAQTKFAKELRKLGLLK